MLELEGVTPRLAVLFGENEIKTVDDVAGLVPDDMTGWREPGPDGKPVWHNGILKKGEMRKDDAQIFIMKARVIAGWVTQEAVDELEAKQVAAQVEAEMDFTEEEKALLALGELGSGGGDGNDEAGDTAQ